MLYVVSTPIGNLEDITLRALRILKEADLILAEDTRRTGILLKHYDIKNKLESFNDHNKQKKTKGILKLLKDRKSIALVSDNGTPAVSDPGFYIVRESIREGIKVVPVPGPSAFLAALVCSGLPTDRFEFYGFMPKKKKKMTEILDNLRSTAVFYDSQYRLVKNLRFIAEKYPEYSVVVGREITKKFEEFVRGSAKEILDSFKMRKVKGEIVLIISATERFIC